MTKTLTFSVPITIPTYQQQHTTYHISHTHISHIHTHIPHSMYHISHITYHISHTTFHISTYHIPHTTFHIPTHQHITYQHTTFHIPHTNIYLTPYYLYYVGVFFIAPIFLFSNIPLSCPKTIPLLEFKIILWNWCLQINGILVNSAFGNVSTS